MLNPEAAAEQLKQWVVEDYQTRREARVALLPAPLRDVALAIIDVNNPDPIGWKEREEQEKREAARQAAYVSLSTLPPAERTQIFAAWFPGLQTAVERGYHQFTRLPYQSGYSRKSFRAASLGESDRYAASSG